MKMTRWFPQSSYSCQGTFQNISPGDLLPASLFSFVFLLCIFIILSPLCFPPFNACFVFFQPSSSLIVGGLVLYPRRPNVSPGVPNRLLVSLGENQEFKKAGKEWRDLRVENACRSIFLQLVPSWRILTSLIRKGRQISDSQPDCESNSTKGMVIQYPKGIGVKKSAFDSL